MNKLLLLAGIFLLSTQAHSQRDGCATVMSDQQLSKLATFQSRLSSSGRFLKADGIRYVPLKIHIVGRNNGTGYYSESQLTDAFCTLNANFRETGFYFYLGDRINYINNDNLYNGVSSAVSSVAARYKDPGMVNVFFHGFSDTWCGVYFPSQDVVLVVNQCAQQGETTWTHELGHFFNLPHTFNGWENNRTPPVSQREKTDRSNCRFSGDGFCDTDPDYVGSRWECPYTTFLTDPNGVTFKPDPSLYMNYASDRCQQRFSPEQMAAMNADLDERRIETINIDTGRPAIPVLVEPAFNATGYNPEFTVLSWNGQPKAPAYLVQVTRFNDWSASLFNKIVYDTTVTLNMLGEFRSYDWRIKPLSQGYFCGDFSSPSAFFTGKINTSVFKLSGADPALSVYPNPATASAQVWLSATFDELFIYDMSGKSIDAGQVRSSGRTLLPALPPGLYSIMIKQGTSSRTLKLMISE